jgi:hypothetical protein
MRLTLRTTPRSIKWRASRSCPSVRASRRRSGTLSRSLSLSRKHTLTHQMEGFKILPECEGRERKEKWYSHTHTHRYTHTYIMGIRTHLGTHIRTPRYTHTHTHRYTHAYIMSIRTHTNARTRARTHTHTHTHDGGCQDPALVPVVNSRVVPVVNSRAFFSFLS